MIEQISETLSRDRMAGDGHRVGVAVSGGADSVFLLHALHQLKLAVAVLHINHNLRGAESAGDEEFVRDLAAQLGLRFLLHSAPVPDGNVEQEARRVRYQFFAEVIAGGHTDLVATGHTLDDQAETVLYRFLRGSGTAGLSGIRPVTAEGIIRPLIETRRAEIRRWLTEREIPWREDSSNANPGFVRNRIRIQHLPELTASLNPALPEVLAATAQWARDEEDYWAAEMDRLEPSHLSFGPEEETVFLRTAPFLELEPARQRRLLRRAIARIKGDLRAIDFRHVEGIRVLTQSWEGSGRLQIPGLDVYRSFDWLRMGPQGYDGRVERDFDQMLEIPGVTRNPERRLVIDVRLSDPDAVYTDGLGLDRDLCSGSLVLRNWRPGDSYRPVGRKSAEKVKTLFQEHRIPLWERRSWPVITQGGLIVWTRKFGYAREFAAGPACRRVLRIREIRQVESPGF